MGQASIRSLLIMTSCLVWVCHVCIRGLSALVKACRSLLQLQDGQNSLCYSMAILISAHLLRQMHAKYMCLSCCSL